MTASTSFQQFQRVSDQVGGAAALRLHAFFGGLGGSVYVPEQATEGHILEKLLGRKAFIDLVAAYRGQTLHVARLNLEPLRNAGRIWALHRQNISRTNIAGLLSVTQARVGQVLKQLEADGFGDLEDAILFSTNEAVTPPAPTATEIK